MINRFINSCISTQANTYDIECLKKKNQTLKTCLENNDSTRYQTQQTRNITLQSTIKAIQIEAQDIENVYRQKYSKPLLVFLKRFSSVKEIFSLNKEIQNLAKEKNEALTQDITLQSTIRATQIDAQDIDNASRKKYSKPLLFFLKRFSFVKEIFSLNKEIPNLANDRFA